MNPKAVVATAAAAAAFHAAAAQASVIVGDESARWQATADAAHVPTPPSWAPINLREAACPISPQARGCWLSDEETIYLNPDPASGGLTPRAFLHELGHAFDWLVLTPQDRNDFRALSGAPSSWPWLTGDGSPAAGEWFAETYYACATDPATLPAPDGGYAYGFNPDPATYQRLCSWLQARPVPSTPFGSGGGGQILPPVPTSPSQLTGQADMPVHDRNLKRDGKLSDRCRARRVPHRRHRVRVIRCSSRPR